MTCEDIDRNSCFVQNPILISGVIIAGGISAGILLFPAANDTTTQYNEYIRNGLIVGSTVIGTVILAKTIMYQKRH